MKKILFTIIAAVSLFCSDAIASEYGESYWPRSYFVSLGMGATVTNGDLNEQSISITDSTGTKTKAYSPDMSLLWTPEITLGANIRQFTLDVTFQYWRAKYDLVKVPEEEYSRIWRLNFEFFYNFFWPEFFQVGLGIGYSYTSMKTENSAFNEDGTFDTELMGSAVAFIANLRYYFTDNIALVPAFKVYENWFKNVWTKPSGSLDLDPYIWQTYITGSIALQFQF